METPIATTHDWMPTEKVWHRLIRPDPAKLATIIDPLDGLTFEELWNDIRNVISTIANQYTDRTCPALHFDELVGEGMFKTAKLISKGITVRLNKAAKRAPTRAEFFAFFRTAINNHIRGQVQKHRFTIKRTGIKPPPKDQRHTSTEPTKPIEISLNDEDAHLQVSEPEDHGDSGVRTMVSDLRVVLTPLEFLVFEQLHEANNAACLLSEIESYRGRTFDKPMDTDVKPGHAALGLGMSEELFKEVSARVRQKVLDYMQHEETAEDLQRNTTIAKLEQEFSVQVPKHFDLVVIRRLFTLLARKNIDRVANSSDLKEWLQAIGAKVPEPRGHTMACFGVLYMRNNRICESCSIKESCAAEAANFGLGDVLIHPEVLGSKQLRIPTLGGAIETPAPVLTTVVPDDPDAGQRDDEIMHFLQENFRLINIRRETPHGLRSELGYKHKERTPSGEKIILAASRKGGVLALRFCNPSSLMRDKLHSVKNGAYLPRNVGAEEAIQLINTHARETFN